MASYIIAGKADDPSYARAEYAAKQVESFCPNIFFKYEMKHPDDWKEFINAVFRKFDFEGYPEDFPGPLVWSHEGQLVGGSAEFVGKVCIEKFGMSSPPSVTDPMFKQIATDNFKQVKTEQYREKRGPSLMELIESSHERASSAGLFQPRRFADRRKCRVQGNSMEVWVSDTLDHERAQFREEFGNGQPARVDARLVVSQVGMEHSHLVVLHPRPIVAKHLVLPLRRDAKDIEGEAGASVELEIPPHNFRARDEEDLSLEDFSAAIEILMSGKGGVATWMGLRGASEYRHPIDTHIEVFPCPVHSTDPDSPLRFPLDLLFERAVKDKVGDLKLLPFRHTFVGFPVPEGAAKPSASELAKAAQKAYETARGSPKKDDSCAVAFSTSWLLIIPLMPPDASSVHHEAWLRMPPPPPCALCGVVICPQVSRSFPEVAGMHDGLDEASAGGDSSDADEGRLRLVTTRAELERIPVGSPEYEMAEREVRISSTILDSPLGILGVWAMPLKKNKTVTSS